MIRRAAAYVIAGIALAWILAACASIPVVPAQPRGYGERERAAVRVDVACNVYGLPGFDDQPHYDDGTMIHIGSGVAVDERHVLTAAHVVACPTLPGVVLTTYDGRHLIAVVTREDVTADVAVLELATADRLHLDIAPPTRAPVLLGSTVCAEAADPQHETHCGAVEYVSDTTVRATFLALHGNSGAGVYDLAGRLVGLVTATAKSGDPISWITPRLP